MNENDYGLVFAGGGTKGAYQVGACRAFDELHLPIRTVLGVSIGALNAALYAQGDLDLLEELYRNVEIDDIIGLPSSVDIDPEKNLLSPGNAVELAHAKLRNEIPNNEPLRRLLEKYVDEEKIRKSPIEMGLITYNTEKKAGDELFIDDIPEGMLIDYLLASACFPIFAPQEIDGVAYRDGGYYDNMPVNTLVKRHFKKIILVDIAGVGRMKKTEDPHVKVKTIRPKEDLGGTFDFDRSNIDKNIQLGYFDTLKAFHDLTGRYYYFPVAEYENLLERFSLDEIDGLEEAGAMYDIERFKKWKADDFLKQVMAAYQQEEALYQADKKDLHLASVRNYIRKGTGIAVTVDLLRHYPALIKDLWIQKAVENYLKAAAGIIACQNEQ
ncbi:patatin-like phospholipase family protein [Catenisphaera adipataccumulans]|jgi:NTE family protein|uniref:NTE family protein n=1 Tax=Catenisphaera adipataccumulans TaxID=700500 RepID=A0A7W8FVX6_9FIRM|nr:patatin-like phospholipase family protein [Catenisphaera adipataccumulans]MBB5182080.1 NTE family protein [Catenisphaera adipataccumulans]